MKPREFAFRILSQAGPVTDFIEHRMEKESPWRALSGPDQGLARELVLGVTRWRSAIDWIIALKTDGRPQRPAVQHLLRLGVYQLFWLDRVPDHAAVHETVQIARDAGLPSQAGFINAVLRGCIRERDSIRDRLAALQAGDPATGWSHPAWLVERWSGRWPPSEVSALLRWNNTPPGVFVRINTLKAPPDAVLEGWRHEGVEHRPVARDWLPPGMAYELTEHPSIAALESFRKGWFYVQDPSTLLAVLLLDPHPGESVLDACAAPGGKTTLMAQRMLNQGRIVAADISQERLRAVAENCARLGATCVECAASTAAVGTQAAFDRILIDAPCSNTGVMRRRTELRWRIQPGEIERLRGEQLGLLRQMAPRLKPGGTLVYSTCSLEPDENRGVVDAFLGEHGGAFVLDSERDLLPFRDQVDGAYCARIRRVQG